MARSAHPALLTLLDEIYAAAADASGSTGTPRLPPLHSLPSGEPSVAMALAPHLARAARIAARLREAAVAAGTALDAIDWLPVGVVGMDEQLQVLFANRAARNVSTENDGFVLASSGPVAGTSRQTRELHAAIQRVIANSRARANVPFEELLLLRRSSGRAPIEIRITPVPFESTSSLLPVSTAAVLYLHDQAAAPMLDERRLQELFGFTPAEARFAAGLAQGLTAQEIAKQQHFKRTTVRWMLERVREKTDARRQSEAVAKILSSLAVLRRRAPTSQ